ncbi:MAG: hypothetical protein IAF38_07460, partial [Bacteroidia bacterium]|nr:hypothetical protein [Bacteroidia bacterium]
KKARFYGWATIGAVYGLIIAAEIMFSRYSDFIVSALFGAVMLLLAIAIPVLGFFLSSKLTPSYTKQEVMFKDQQGYPRIRIVLTFRD